MSVPGLVGIVGLARSGRAAAKLALASGSGVFASDAGNGDAVREAAVEIRKLGAEAETGGHTVERLAECDLLVVSPGVPPDAPVLRDERLRDIPWTSELEFAFQHLDAPVIAVTGTNGKTTVTAWIAHLLRTSGFDAAVAGNIGTPLSEVALRDPPPEWVVAEASSYQLGRIDTFAPRVGVLTNLAPDHLDRYPDVAHYYADKAHLFDNATADSRWVLNAEDGDVLGLASGVRGRRLFFRIASEPASREDGGWVDAAGRLLLRLDGRDTELVRSDELRLLGLHNRANALTAALAAYAAMGTVGGIREGLRTFAPLRHRLEPVVEAAGVLWINDSKATNVASARVAIESMDRPTILLLGGRPKGESLDPLADSVRRRVKVVLAFGEAAAEVKDALRSVVPVEEVHGDFATVVRRAGEHAAPGDAVLLAPACASFDMFEDYEDRGRQFEQRVAELTGQRPEARHG